VVLVGVGVVQDVVVVYPHPVTVEAGQEAQHAQEPVQALAFDQTAMRGVVADRQQRPDLEPGDHAAQQLHP
jgi:hypothetical protein